MANIIWNEKEVKKINKTLLSQVNSLKIEKDNNLTVITVKGEKCNNYSRFLYDKFINEITSLYYTDSIDKVEEVLTLAKNVQADKTNPLHFGLICSLAKRNPENHDEVFVIFKELIGLYESVAYSVAQNIVNNLNIEETLIKINEIIDTKKETNEEIIVRNEINKIFAFANGVNEHDLFKSLIKRLDSEIKLKLISKMQQINTNRIRKELAIPKEDVKAMKRENSRKYCAKAHGKSKSLTVYYRN